MVITIDKDLFSETLATASRFTSNKLSSVSSLQGVLMKGSKGSVSFYSTNLNTFYTSTLEIADADSFQVIIEPKKMMEFLAFLPSGNLSLEFKEKQVTLKMNKTKGNFPLILSDDFPLPPGFPSKSKKIDADLLMKELPLVLFSASRDDSRPNLTGINFINNDNELLLVATDGFRLSIIKDKKIGDFPGMIVPADFLQEVVRHMKDSKDIKFNYSSEEKMVVFEFGSSAFYSRLIEGNNPPFERVIPPEITTTVTVDKAEMQRNIKLISVFARDFSNVIVCEFKKDGMQIRPKKEGNSENTAFQDIEFKGEDITIAFNFKFLLDLLNHIEGKNVIIEMLRPDAPAIFKTDSHTSFMHIIMPIRLQE